MKKWKIGTASFLVVVLIVTLGVAIATDNSARNGTRDDPLVARSYLEALQPLWIQGMTEDMRGVLDGMVDELDAHYDQLVRNLDNIITGLLLDEGIDLRDPEFVELVVRGVMDQIDGTAGGEAGSALFRRIDLRAGQTLRGQIGTEVILRLGSATGVNTVATGNPAMVSLTSASNLNDGAALVANHLYFVTIANNGLRAGSNGATVFVRGPAEVVDP
ncbi:MAG: hypothetical protein FWE06_05575 [Oscillospiraceae bacterium]|nr:hypothetical protein [Oscillospiraceae bacterium]